jgi:hypothetical protein
MARPRKWKDKRERERVLWLTDPEFRLAKRRSRYITYCKNKIKRHIEAIARYEAILAYLVNDRETAKARGSERISIRSCARAAQASG